CAIAERATEPVRGDVRAPHAPSQVPHHRVSQRLAVLAGEDEVITGGTKMLHPLEHGERGIRKRDAMPAAGLHARARYDPNLIEQIKLPPLRADHLADPTRSQDRKFEHTSCDAFANTKIAHAAGASAARQPGVMLDQAHLRASR